MCLHEKGVLKNSLQFLVSGPWSETLLNRESNAFVFLCFPGKEFKKPSLQMCWGRGWVFTVHLRTTTSEKLHI